MRRGLILGFVLALLGAGSFAPARAAGKTEATTYVQDTSPTEVVMSNDIGDIRVIKAGPAQLVVTKNWAFQAPTVTVKREGHRLTATAACPEQVSLNNCSVDFELQIPDAFALDVKQGIGSVEVRGVAGNLNLENGVGETRVLSVHGYALRVRQSSGGAILGGLHVRRVDARTGNGNVVVDSESAPDAIEAHSTNGDVNVVVPAAAYAITTHVTNGNKEVRGLTSDPAASRTINAATGNGSVLVRSHGASDAPTTPAPRRHDKPSSPTSTTASTVAPSNAVAPAGPPTESTPTTTDGVDLAADAAASNTASDNVGMWSLVALLALIGVTANTARVVRRRALPEL